MTLLITGATGNVGSEIVKLLLADDPKTGAIPFRIAVPEPDKARARFPDAPDVTRLDFRDPSTYEASFRDVTGMFLLRPPDVSNVPRDVVPLLEAARRSGVRRIVFLSLQGVENNRATPHYKIERAIEGMGFAYTFLRAGFFMQNLTTTHRAEIRDEDRLFIPAGKALTAFVDARDLGAVAFRGLVEPGHENKAYTLTGAEALGYDQVAHILSDVLGRKITYANPNIAAFVLAQLRHGKPLDYALITAMLYTITRFGNARTVTHDVELVLGRPPIRFRQFAEDFRTMWM